MNRVQNIINPLPQKIAGVKEPVICLNSETSWQFLFETLDDIPSLTSDNRDYNFAKLDSKDWNSVIVPGELAMQGYDIDNNNEYYYKTTVKIPEDYNGKEVFLRFDGVYSNARIWVNNTYIRSHVGGFTTWYCDITDTVEAGEEITIVVGIADLEGNSTGLYNADKSTNQRDSSWASFYAHHNICGILRNVSLVAYEKCHITDCYCQTSFEDNYNTGILELEISLNKASTDCKIVIDLRDRSGKSVANGEMNYKNETKESITLKIDSPNKWDSEHPYLYTLVMSLYLDGEEIQQNCRNIGFREILFNGKNNTDHNKIYINGDEVKLRGVCRHDVSYKLGRSMTREELFREVEDYKKCNINFIRTSHYPASEDLLDACDELGVYVEQENAICFQGANDCEIYCKPEEYLSQATEMIQRDCSRTSIIIWSLGNESSYEKTKGFKLEYDYIKEVDKTRPVIFSYPFTLKSSPLPFDIISKHYEQVYQKNFLGHVSMPVLHDEFAHVNCYELNRQKYDSNVRNYWGKSIKDGWENIYDTDGALGCAIWVAGDDVFFLPENVKKRWQNHSVAHATGYGEWGCIHDVFMRIKPEAYLTKKAFTPVLIDIEKCLYIDKKLIIPVKNRFNHTNLNELVIKYKVDNEEYQKVDNVLDVNPKETGYIEIDGINKGTEILLEFYDQHNELLDLYKIPTEVKEMPVCKEKKVLIPCIEDSDKYINVSTENMIVSINKAEGCIEKASIDGETLITGGPYLHISGFDTLEEKGKVTKIYSYYGDDCATVLIYKRYREECDVNYIVKIYSDNRIETSYCYEVLNQKLKLDNIGEIGIQYDIPNSADKVTWQKEGLYSIYPDYHIGRLSGTASKKPICEEKYGEKPFCKWEESSKNYMVFTNDENSQEMFTNDFKALRENIYYYQVAFEDKKSSVKVESKGQLAANIINGDKSYRLNINNLWAYPELNYNCNWGNDSGRNIALASGSVGSSVIRLTKE